MQGPSLEHLGCNCHGDPGGRAALPGWPRAATHFLTLPSARRHFIYRTKTIGSAKSAGERDTLLCRTSTIETGVMGLSETACTEHVRATRTSNASSERGVLLRAPSFVRSMRLSGWRVRKKRRKRSWRGAKSDISCFFFLLLLPSCWHWDKMSNLACISGWRDTSGMESSPSMRKRQLPVPLYWVTVQMKER